MRKWYVIIYNLSVIKMFRYTDFIIFRNIIGGKSFLQTCVIVMWKSRDTRPIAENIIPVSNRIPNCYVACNFLMKTTGKWVLNNLPTVKYWSLVWKKFSVNMKLPWVYFHPDRRIFVACMCAPLLSDQLLPFWVVLMPAWKRTWQVRCHSA